MAGLLDRLHGLVANQPMPPIQGGIINNPQQSKVEGLLGNPLFNLGVGLLGASGPSLQPVGFGQALGQATQYMTERQGQQARLQAMRDELKQRKDQADARKQLGGLLSHPAATVPAAIRNPNAIQSEQGQITSLLSQAYPEQYGQAMVQSLLGTAKDPRLSTAVNDFEYIYGRRPSPEEYQALTQKDNTTVQDLLARVELDAALNARDTERTDAARTERRRTEGMRSSVQEIDNLLSLLERAEGTYAQPGFFAGGIRTGASLKSRIDNLAGSNPGAASEVAEILQKMQKGFTRLSTGTIPEAFLGSDSKLRMFQSQLPDINLETGAIMSILDSYLEGIISEDYIDDGELNSSEEAVELRERIRRMTGGTQAPAQPGSPHRRVYNPLTGRVE